MQHVLQSTTTISVRIPSRIKKQLNELAEATQRTTSFLTAEAIQNYISLQAWQVKSIQDAVKKADSKKAKFAGHDEVMAWLDSWGTKNELRPPKCK
jgi:predicted transcriptional regulator